MKKIVTTLALTIAMAMVIGLFAACGSKAPVITFNLNGGTSAAIPSLTLVADEDGKYFIDSEAIPADPTRADSATHSFEFAGWATTAAGGTAFDFAAEFTANATAFAQWTSTELPGEPEIEYIEFSSVAPGHGDWAVLFETLELDEDDTVINADFLGGGDGMASLTGAISWTDGVEGIVFYINASAAQTVEIYVYKAPFEGRWDMVDSIVAETSEPTVRNLAAGDNTIALDIDLGADEGVMSFLIVFGTGVANFTISASFVAA
jgi:hypothetical protein